MLFQIAQNQVELDLRVMQVEESTGISNIFFVVE